MHPSDVLLLQIPAALAESWHLPLIFLLSYSLYAFVGWNFKRRRMPPGPKGLPFIGSEYQVPSIKPWRKFAEWNRQYGPVVSLFLGSTPVVVLGKAQPAWDLLEKRSDIYSSRPRFIMGGEIFSDNLRGLMLPSGEGWRKFRRVLHGGLHSRKADTYRDIQSLESKLLMSQLLTDPKNYENHIRRYAASVVVSLTYGKRIDSVDEWIVKENMASMACSLPGKYIVESWPWLLKLPRSLQWFRWEAEEQRRRDVKLLTHLLDDVKSRTAEGTCPPCLASETLSKREEMGVSELQVAYTVSSPFGAGIETTFFLLCAYTWSVAMLHYPEAMKKAQAELDEVIGHDRMPGYEDRDTLPYVRALINEILRWRPVAVLGGTAHAVTEDDEYNGMFIPKGASVFANMAGIMQDPEMFPSPDTFCPERFITTTDPRLQSFELPFGFGRRICPGMHLALNSIFINVSRILWGFDIRPVKNAQGQDVLPDVWEFTNGFNSWPVSFECNISARNPKVKACVEREWDAAKEALGKWQ
ncbi:cytochrome P450 monooxygenase 29 [Heterobasidion irregulare TC 32-1]|uniref:Cytochrome P450 monooxygenase 29 n=1 Tax=Heterobasidion irregulare (strain TC 32-1) TaxID=747525 RepID=W4JWK7_HETIT|nr:cytochrome P450 monooxygenase 29 [Heterobasidion irregulare TC 32-1]ETW77266.1 cytochrome P450 monooxygenase 29 [Heterobasidion irregulare TC 32-1]